MITNLPAVMTIQQFRATGGKKQTAKAMLTMRTAFFASCRSDKLFIASRLITAKTWIK
ncbi:hypothetical protein MU1_02310 [Paenibacillus glycanilyticus]|uniref:Uncharacterized protein n=1 Tax=Paenibacillus glycanilyticus TaxID=126569 RepID=A0ABQ6GA03_9BACL|nr:hypothetical protein MU1_02310 [Paenibacillus glycanilyticus]